MNVGVVNRSPSRIQTPLVCMSATYQVLPLKVTFRRGHSVTSSASTVAAAGE